MLKAITLPFPNDEVGNTNKNLGWFDINKDARELYFNFISEHINEFIEDKIELEDFVKSIPSVIVEMNFIADGADEYYIRRWINSIDCDPHCTLLDINTVLLIQKLLIILLVF